jgi:copper chaperone NosL
LTDQEIAHYLITDFTSPGTLIDAKSALYVRSGQIKSPMAGNLAAFHNQGNLRQYNNSWKGEELTWMDLIAEHK